MDISAISKYYELKSVDVKPNQLLLDPTNPRIAADVQSDRKFTSKELTSPDVQAYILSVINKQVHHIADIIRGIRSSGFIDKGDHMIVKKIPKTDKYLVIEGNRRTTAIQHLLSDAASLKRIVRDTLTKLHVKEFFYKPNSEFTEDTVIDILLGTIHITGRLPWSALEKARYIYKSYLRELRKYTADSRFEYDVNCSREVATFFNLSVKEVRNAIGVYRVYEQLKDQCYAVTSHHFSLIEMAVKDKKLSDEYFEVSPVTLRFSNRGLVHFDRLCIRNGKPINNPTDFRNFAWLFRHGTEYEITLVESGEQPISKMVDRADARVEEKEFERQLEGIKDDLECLQPAAFRGSNAEIQVIEKIRDLVNNKLWSLAKSSLKRS